MKIFKWKFWKNKYFELEYQNYCISVNYADTLKKLRETQEENRILRHELEEKTIQSNKYMNPVMENAKHGYIFNQD